MNVKELLSILKENKNKELLFEYSENKYAGTNYHLTEVKNVAFETVDCGGTLNDWKETHIQLWESPTEIGKDYYITADKAVAILERVNSIRSLWLETEVKVEFGNNDFHTSVLSIENMISDEKTVTVKLFANKTECKALEACGVSENSLTVATENEEASCCDPNGGCC
jgi:hypothetical protein